MLQRHVGRHQLHDLLIDLEAGQIHRRHPELAGQHLGDLDLPHEAHLHQHVAEAHARPALLRQRLIELFLRDQTLADEQVAYAHCTGC